MQKINVTAAAVNTDPEIHEFVTLGDAAHRAVAALWWRMRRNGVTLPAEAGVILIETEN